MTTVGPTKEGMINGRPSNFLRPSSTTALALKKWRKIDQMYPRTVGGPTRGMFERETLASRYQRYEKSARAAMASGTSMRVGDRTS